ncbi:MAG TPA: CRISPR-associated endonuclease Cas1 [Hadesarchaea archaeon]|nr:CRISPR-associated endonuclease Cas1 [Hadesarchaea archaeon]
MATLYLIEQGQKLCKTSRRLTVERDGEIVAEIPIFKVDRVFIYGNIQITTQAIGFLLGEGIPTAFFYTDGRLKGILQPMKSKDIPLRVVQFKKATDPEFSLELAKIIVKGKLKSQKRLLQRFMKNHPEADFQREEEQIEMAIESVDRQTSLSSLLGVEGAGTSSYFSAYRRMIREWGGFKGRKRRPPPDPINALLSYGYTVLTAEMFFMTYTAGFEPYLGFYHGVRYGRPALALDLIEEFRHVVVDMLVLDLISRKMVEIDDFYEADEGFRMRRRLIKKFFEQYERRMGRLFTPPGSKSKSNMRKVMSQQVYKLKDYLLEGKAYEPYFPS